MTQTTAPSLHINQASLIYHQQPLFKNLTFTLQGGLITCLLGPSGVGKSSLLYLIAGLADTSVENLHTTVIDASDQLPVIDRITYMAQNDSLLPWLSVLDNVLIGFRLRGQTQQLDSYREQAIALLTQVGLSSVIHHYPAALSGGMRQRVALARTFLEQRPIVLMDEPFSALDAITRYRLQELTAVLLKGRTVLLVTHDPMEALRLGQRIHVMSGLPAQLDNALVLPDEPPHEVLLPPMLELQAELMRRLLNAQQEMPIC